MIMNAPLWIGEVWDVIALIEGADGLLNDRENANSSVSNLLNMARERLVKLGRDIDQATAIQPAAPERGAA